MDKEFADGIIFKQPHENAPEFVIGKLAIKVQDCLSWLSGKQEDWLNLDIKMSQAGKPYVMVSDWKKNETTEKDVDNQMDELSDTEMF